MPRYWVNVSLYSSADDEEMNHGEKFSEKQKKVYNEAAKALMKEGCTLSTSGMIGQLVFKTEDLDEAREFIKTARTELEKVEKATGLSLCDGLDCISSQPECPKCGYLGRFSEAAENCPHCGTKLTESKYFD